MKKYLLSLLLVLGLTACGNKTQEQQADTKPTIKIGATLPLSGEYALIGKANQEAILMALQKWQNKKTKYNYDVIFEDDQMMTSRAAVVTNKFISIDKVKAILSTWGIVGPVVANIADKNKVISMACAAMSEITKPYYSFNHFTQDDKLADKLIYILKKNNVKSVVLVHTATAAFDEKANTLQKELTTRGIKILAIERHNIKETDFRIAIHKLEELNPDAYINFVMMPGTVNFIKQFQQITQGKRLMVGLHSFNEMPQKYWPLVNGLYSVRDSSGTAEFAKMFQNKTGIENQPCNGNHFDNLDLLIWAFENTKVREGETIPNTEDVVKTLQDIKNWQGAVGKISVDDKGLINSEAILDIYKDGQPVEIKD